MQILQWDSCLETGLEEVDQQHRHLVQLTNDFGTLLSLDKIESDDVENLFSELVSYSEYHFEEEEKLMDETGVDPGFSDTHRKIHEGFINDVLLMKRMIADDKAALPDLFEFLMNWLVYHILGDDKKMAGQIHAIQNGHEVQPALLADQKEVDSASGMLLLSLNNLFSQVSRRNKELAELNMTLEQRVEQRTSELQEANHKLAELVLTDSLTGLSNRRHAMQILEKIWHESEQNNHSFGCLMIDADGFKRINDSFGHGAGDTVLCQLANNLAYSVRTDDFVCRLGGDEFLVICPNTDLDGAHHIAELIHKHIAQLEVEVEGGSWVGSISVGVAVKSDVMGKPEDLLKKADEKVYEAKKAGRNCVRV